MDWKKKMDDMKAQADSVIKKAESQYGEMKAKMDKDGDGVPDAIEAAMAKAREAGAAAKTKFGELKARLDKDGDGTPDALEKLGEQTKHAIDNAKSKAGDFAKAVQEKLGGKKPSEKPPENA